MLQAIFHFTLKVLLVKSALQEAIHFGQFNQTNEPTPQIHKNDPQQITAGRLSILVRQLGLPLLL